MIQLRARVRSVTDAAKHYVGQVDEHGAITKRELPAPAYVEIVQRPEGFYLLRFNDAGGILSDTWHPSLDDAKEQAVFEFTIADEDWMPVS